MANARLCRLEETISARVYRWIYSKGMYSTGDEDGTRDLYQDSIPSAASSVSLFFEHPDIPMLATRDHVGLIRRKKKRLMWLGVLHFYKRVLGSSLKSTHPDLHFVLGVHGEANLERAIELAQEASSVFDAGVDVYLASKDTKPEMPRRPYDF